MTHDLGARATDDSNDRLPELRALVGDRLGFVPFAVVSVFLSFALLPLTLTPVSEPAPVEAPHLSLAMLVRISPLGVSGAFTAGLLTGAAVTAVVQSSSVTTVLLVGFVSAGLMAFAPSVGCVRWRARPRRIRRRSACG